MSLVDLYSVEAKFDESQKEYVSLMNSLNYSCLGKEKNNKMCQRASELNAKMQTSLINMSNLIVKTKPQNNTLQQRRLLKIADKLEADMNSLVTDDGMNTNSAYLAEMNQQQAFTWGFASMVVIALVIYQYKKI
jgi:hypothetical protein